MLFAIIILGLSAYGIRWIAYNVLIYSLVVCLCTLGVCLYMLASSIFLHKLYNMWAFLALHIWMIIFWIVQFSLVANLAAIWASPSCSYSIYYGYYCSRYVKRDSTTFEAYWGALVAGSVFGAFEFVLWLGSLIILGIHIHRHRAAGNPSAPPPIYQPNNQQGTPMEKFGSNAQPQSQQPQQPAQTAQQQYTQPAQQPQGQYMPQPPQPVYNQPLGQQFTTAYTQQSDPVNRQSTISPVTVAAQSTYSSPPQNTAELATPQHAGHPQHNPNAAELAEYRG